MPRNQVIGGNKRRKGKKNSTYSINQKDLIKKDDDQMYARVVALLGNGRLNALCDDGETRLCKIRGKMMKKDFIKTDGIILVSRRDYEDKKADVIHKYNDDEVRMLTSENNFKKDILLKGKRAENNQDEEFNLDFADYSDNDEDEKLKVSNISRVNTNDSYTAFLDQMVIESSADEKDD